VRQIGEFHVGSLPSYRTLSLAASPENDFVKAVASDLYHRPHARANLREPG
jgi:hypothetical protein